MSGVVYRVFSADDTLLYIGASGGLGQRLTHHEATKEWWSEVSRITLEHFPTREAAFAAELAAIEAEGPLHDLLPRSRGLTEAELAARARRRDERDGRVAQHDAEQWCPHGDVLCGNCASRPTRLPKGVAVADTECPRCGMLALAVVEKAAA